MIDRSLFLKVTKDFWNWELLPPELFARPNINPNWYLSKFLLTFPQSLRDYFGKSVTINDWASGGSLENRGIRLPDCEMGAKLSFHRFGLAVDVNIIGLSQIEIVDAVIKNKSKFPLVTAFEDLSFTNGWNHFDGRNTSSNDLLKVIP